MILLQEPYFLLFNTIFQESFCIGLRSLRSLWQGLFSLLNTEYTVAGSVPPSLFSWSLMAAMQIISKRIGCRKPRELQSTNDTLQNRIHWVCLPEVQYRHCL